MKAYTFCPNHLAGDIEPVDAGIVEDTRVHGRERGDVFRLVERWVESG